MYTGITFNSVDLTTLVPGNNGIQFWRIDHLDAPDRLLDFQKLARAPGSKLIDDQLDTKIISLYGTLSGTTKALFEANRDLLLSKIQASNAVLRIPVAGANRDFTGTFKRPDLPYKPGGGLAEFTLTFVCTDPLGYLTSATTDVSAVVITTTPSTKTFAAIGGSYYANPTITAVLGSGTGLTNKTMTITNQAGNALVISRTFVAADSIVIDVGAQTVKVNGVLTDYTGTFPTLAVGDTQITYADTLTTRSVTLTVTHKNRYL